MLSCFLALLWLLLSMFDVEFSFDKTAASLLHNKTIVWHSWSSYSEWVIYRLKTTTNKVNVSSKWPENWRIDLATPRLEVQYVIHYTTTTFEAVRYNLHILWSSKEQWQNQSNCDFFLFATVKGNYRKTMFAKPCDK